jgi:hypothetical protein
MTQFDQTAVPMKSLFTDHPDLTPFNTLPAQTPLNQINPGSTAQLQLEREWSLASDSWFAGKERKLGAADPNKLNHAIWYSATGFKHPYPGESRLLRPTEVSLRGSCPRPRRITPHRVGRSKLRAPSMARTGSPRRHRACPVAMQLSSRRRCRRSQRGG